MSRATFPGDPDFRPFKATPAPTGEEATGGQPEARVKLICAADITPQAIRWVWPGWLAAGKLHILAGAPGTGKSTLAFALAASITTAGRWPDGSPAELGEAVIWSGEDDPEDTIVPRLMACGADLKRIHILGGMEGGDPRPFDPATDMGALRFALAGRDIRLLIVDPIVSAVAGDSHKNTEVRRALQPLVDLATATGCAVLGISHFSKGTAGRDPVERVTGSLGFGALARVVLVAAKLPEGEHNGARLLARAKSNIGPDSGGVHYHLEQVAIPGHPDITNTRVTWGKLVEGTARDLLAAAEQPEGEDRTATDEAREWLATLLAQGAMNAKKIHEAAEGVGIKRKALLRAKDRLKVTTRKQEFAGGWWWSLPDEESPVSPRIPEESLTQKEGTLGFFDAPPKIPSFPQESQDTLKSCWGTFGDSSDGGHLGDSQAWATVDL
ncbi:MAG: AAA family ATPase [Trichloromonadaceae bacterium]